MIFYSLYTLTLQEGLATGFKIIENNEDFHIKTSSAHILKILITKNKLLQGLHLNAIAHYPGKQWKQQKAQF